MALVITRSRVVDSPIGPLTLAGTDDVLLRLCMHDQAHAPVEQPHWPRDERSFDGVVALLDAYFAGEQIDVDVKIHLEGTAFQQEVWQALRRIPHGVTWSYGELAAYIARPRAARAVGCALSRNPIAIIVPCHRVVGADGALGGFAGGLDRKRTLLEIESRVPTASTAGS